MSGSWVGRPSWMTVGIVPLRLVSVPEVGVISSVTRSSLHALPRGGIYPSVGGHVWRARHGRRGHGLRAWGNSGGLLPTSKRRGTVSRTNCQEASVELDPGWWSHPDRPRLH